jgi:membrane protein DedA with SNARE-associated domain
MLPLLLLGGAHKQLPGVFHHFQHLLDHYGYLAVAVVLFAENTGVPFPGETVLIAAALYAGVGGLNIWLVGIIAMSASVAGSCFGYWVGAKGGRRLADRWGKYVFLTPSRLDKVADFFERRGVWVIVLGRFVDGLRQFMSIVVGLSEMTFRRFLVFTSIGAVLWCATWTAIGYVAGDHVETISRYFTYVAIGLALIVVAAIGRHVVSRRRERTTAA